MKDWFCCHHSTCVINDELNYMDLEYVNMQVARGHLQQLFFCTVSIYAQEPLVGFMRLTQVGSADSPLLQRKRSTECCYPKLFCRGGRTALCVPAVIRTSSLWHDWAQPSVCLVAHPTWEAWSEAREGGKLFARDLCWQEGGYRNTGGKIKECQTLRPGLVEYTNV